MDPVQDRTRVGEVRPSQLLFTFGIGSIIDLPHLAVMVMGLDDWPVGYTKEIGEERLLAAVQERLGQQVKSLRTPPLPSETDRLNNTPLDESNRIGVPVAPFPTWMRCPRCALLAPLGELFMLKTDPYRADQTRYVHLNCTTRQPPPVLPARFLVACENGHLDDFPWVQFVHGGPTACKGTLRLKVLGLGEAADVQVSCDHCGAQRRMSDAIGPNAAKNLPRCTAFHPHLRSKDDQECGAELRTITLGASNSWFPVTLSVLSIPSATDDVAKLVEEHWVALSKATSLERLEGYFDLWLAEGMRPDLTKHPVHEVWARIAARQSGEDSPDAEPVSLKDPEWSAFSQPDAAEESRDFRLQAVDPPTGFAQQIERTVLCHRLRQVQAAVGFTRIDSLGDASADGEGDLDRVVSLSSRPPTWVPATDVRGEGIFLQIREDVLEAWCTTPAVAAREAVLRDGHCRWRRRRAIANPSAAFPGIRYVLLHSLAHAILRQLATECGYTAASIRERIYCADPGQANGPQSGILIYTCAPDSEGTLGGLVELGSPASLGRHLGQALSQILLCAADPLCAEHVPDQDGTATHAAACHACLLAPETSCECGNRYLDRAVLVPVLGSHTPPFFG